MARYSKVIPELKAWKPLLDRYLQKYLFKQESDSFEDLHNPLIELAKLVSSK